MDKEKIEEKDVRLLRYAVEQAFDGAMRDGALALLNRLVDSASEAANLEEELLNLKGEYLPGGAVCATTAIISTARKRDSSGRTRAGGGLCMEGIPMRSAGISTSDRERTGIREGALFSCRICRMYGVYGSPACWYAGLLYL